MRILITNDDGVNSSGLKILMDTLAQEHQLVVVAPDRERSATGHALTLHHPLRVEKLDSENPNIELWQTTGTPTDCIKLALCSLLEDANFNLVITGINHGPNLGSDILYSGTVNAALEGAIYSIPSIAISLTDGYEIDDNFKKPALFLLKFLREFPKLELKKKIVLNINFPSSAEPEFKNIKIAELGNRNYCDCYEKREDPRGKIYYWLSGYPIVEGESADSDVVLTNQGHITITPIHFKLGDAKIIAELKNHFEKDTD